MKGIILAVSTLALVGCASMPRHCLTSGALAGSIAAAGGYVGSTQLSGKTREVDSYATPEGDIINTYTTRRTGTLYNNREAVAVGTGLIAGTIAMTMCARR